AFFDARGGDRCSWVRELAGDVPEPSDGIADAAWQDRVSGREPHEICLDVTQFDYPVGDFCWMVFRPYDATESGKRGLLDWPDVHTFIQIERATMRLICYWDSPRPVRSCAARVVIDITGTPLEAHYREHGPVFGNFVVRADGTVGFRADATASGAPSLDTLLVLEAAATELDPIDISTIQSREGVLVERS